MNGKERSLSMSENKQENMKKNYWGIGGSILATILVVFLFAFLIYKKEFYYDAE